MDQCPSDNTVVSKKRELEEWARYQNHTVFRLSTIEICGGRKLKMNKVAKQKTRIYRNLPFR